MTPSIAAANTFTYSYVANNVVSFLPTYAVLQDATGRARINTDLNIVGNINPGGYLNYPQYILPSNISVNSLTGNLVSTGNVVSNSATFANLSSNVASVGVLTVTSLQGYTPPVQTLNPVGNSIVYSFGNVNTLTSNSSNIQVLTSQTANVANLRYTSAVGTTLNVSSIFCSNIIGYAPNLLTIAGNALSYTFGNTSSFTSNTANITTLSGNSSTFLFANASNLTSNAANITTLTGNSSTFLFANASNFTS
ncbi:MAG: hypothetical protein ACOYBT_10365, partial [Polynucleobacter sp.]